MNRIQRFAKQRWIKEANTSLRPLHNGFASRTNLALGVETQTRYYITRQMHWDEAIRFGRKLRVRSSRSTREIICTNIGPSKIQYMCGLVRLRHRDRSAESKTHGERPIGPFDASIRTFNNAPLQQTRRSQTEMLGTKRTYEEVRASAV